MNNIHSDKWASVQMKNVLTWVFVIAIILIPFALFGELIEQYVEELISNARSISAASAMLIFSALLAGDVFLPIPSSLISTGAGYLWGFAVGTVVSLLGMTLGCLLGYIVAQQWGRFVGNSLSHSDRGLLLKGMDDRFSDWFIVFCRPVPVLAEASVFYAALSGMKPTRFMALCSGSNLGISLVYAAAGAFSADLDSFLIAFLAAIAIPGIALLSHRLILRYRADSS